MNYARVIAPTLFGLSLFAVACGGSDDESAPAAQAGTVNPQAAKSTASSAITAASTAVKTNNGLGAAAQMQSASSSAQSIVSPSAGSVPQAIQPDLGSLTLAVGAGCTCEATRCVFSACKDNPGVEINGEISWDGGHVVCKNLNYKVMQAGGVSNLDMTTNCDLTLTDTKMVGTLSSKGSTSYAASGAAGTYTWDSTVKFNDVTYTNGTPTGGSIDASSTVSVAGQTYAGSSNVKFP